MPGVLNAGLDEVLNAMTGNGTDLIGLGLKVHLFKNNLSVLPTSTIGDFTEADYATYAAVVPGGISSASGGSSGVSTAAINDAVFAPGTLGSPQDCYGWYLTDTSGNLIGAANFPSVPLNMGGAVTSLTISLTLTLAD